MNPAIVIPSYWAWEDRPTDVGEVGAYDHVTPINRPLPELETCLSSLDKVRGVLRVIVLLVAPHSCEDSARARVEGICRMHPNLNPMIVGRDEGRLMMRVINDIVPSLSAELVSLRGYGAIRNMGLAVAAVLGHDVVVFLDDDEVVLDKDFLIDGVYGLGRKNRQGIPIWVKTGYYLNRLGSPYADASDVRWCDRLWSRRDDFNQLMERMLAGPRISRANSICGGCFAVSAQAFTKVPFDSAITRGEDLDYLFNLRMKGIDVWFDSKWFVQHVPPDIPSYAARFIQDVYRWLYERKKLEVCNETRGLRPVTPESLMPYPGEWISRKADARIVRTALRRAIMDDESEEYVHFVFGGLRQARRWADESASKYLSLITYWPRIMDVLWDNRLLARRLAKMGTARLAWLPKAGSSSESEAAPAADTAPAADVTPAADTAPTASITSTPDGPES